MNYTSNTKQTHFYYNRHIHNYKLYLGPKTTMVCPVSLCRRIRTCYKIIRLMKKNNFINVARNKSTIRFFSNSVHFNCHYIILIKIGQANWLRAPSTKAQLALWSPHCTCTTHHYIQIVLLCLQLRLPASTANPAPVLSSTTVSSYLAWSLNLLCTSRQTSISRIFLPSFYCLLS